MPLSAYRARIGVPILSLCSPRIVPLNPGVGWQLGLHHATASQANGGQGDGEGVSQFLQADASSR